MIAASVRILPKLPRSMSAVDADLVAVCKLLVNGQARWPLFLHGPCGSGKTSAALALCDIARSAVYSTADAACDKVMQAEPADIAAFWRQVAEKDLAVLDELGARQTVGDLHFSTVKKFCDLRETEAHRVAVYVSNVGPKTIASLYDDRIASRILAGTIFNLGGRDRRPTK